MQADHKIKKFWPMFIIGTVLMPIFGAAARIATGGGHGNYLIAAVLLPWAMLVAVLSNYITVPALVIAALQWPIYGVYIARLITVRIAKIGFLAILHLIVLALALVLDRNRIFLRL